MILTSIISTRLARGQRRQQVRMAFVKTNSSIDIAAAHYYDVNVENFEAIRVDVMRNAIPEQYAFKCQVHRFRHMSDARFRKYIYTLCDPDGMPHRALIYYTW